MSTPKLFLAIKEIADNTIRKNFQAIQDFLGDSGQLNGFVFLEFEVTKNEANYKIAHSLGSAPKDVIVTRLIAPAAARLVLNHGKFTTSQIDATISGLTSGQSLKCRMLVGTYPGNTNSTAIAETDTQEIHH